MGHNAEMIELALPSSNGADTIFDLAERLWNCLLTLINGYSAKLVNIYSANFAVECRPYAQVDLLEHHADKAPFRS